MLTVEQAKRVVDRAWHQYWLAEQSSNANRMRSAYAAYEHALVAYQDAIKYATVKVSKRSANEW